MMTLTLTNLPEFRSAMAAYSKHVPRELAHALNWKTLVIAKDAMRGTPKAERARIEYQMGVGGYQTKVVKQGKNKGKIRRTNLPIWFPHPRALNIVLGRLKAKGQTAIGFHEAMEKARKLVMAKIRAIGTAKAGWNLPIRQMAAAVKREQFVPASKHKVKIEGYGKPSAPSQWKKFTEVSYDVLAKTRGHTIGAGTTGAAYPKVHAALNTALQKEAKRTLEYIARTQGKLIGRFIQSYR
jgi:hypothetical protein